MRTKPFMVALLASGCFALLFGMRLVMRAHLEASAYSCFAARSAIDGLKEVWSLQFHKSSDDVPTWADLAKVNGGRPLDWRCPHGGVYSLGRLGEHVRCSVDGAGDSHR